MFDIDAPQTLGGGLTWTAKCVSFDQRNQDVYFGIRLAKNGEAVDHFLVVVMECPDTKNAHTYYLQALQRLAEAGEPNTTHGYFAVAPYRGLPAPE